MLSNNKTTYKQEKTLGKLQEQPKKTIPTNPHPLMQPLLNLYTKLSKIKLTGLLLITLFIFLPWGLGKHLINTDSIVLGKQINYLIPCVYIQDVLIILTVLFSIVRGRGYPNSSSKTATGILFLFTLAMFFSTFFAGRFFPSAFFFLRITLYLLFFIFITEIFSSPYIRRWFFRILILNLLLLCLVGFFQFYSQSSVFNNYLFFGEQPYNIFTPFIAKESYNGIVKIPPYGTFPHPNVFAGYILISLTLSLGYLLSFGKKNLTVSICLSLFCVAVIFLTKSYTAWVALVFGFFIFLFSKLIKNVRFVSWFMAFISILTIFVGLLFPLYSSKVSWIVSQSHFTNLLSVDRRSALLKASAQMFIEKPLFGWGVNSFTYSFEPFYKRPDVVLFLQPAHNVYALVAAETGVFGLLLFILLTVFSIYHFSRNGAVVYSISLTQIVVLSSFDHYFFTIPQTLLFFILTLMMGFTYTKFKDCL